MATDFDVFWEGLPVKPNRFGHLSIFSTGNVRFTLEFTDLNLVYTCVFSGAGKLRTSWEDDDSVWMNPLVRVDELPKFLFVPYSNPYSNEAAF